ncbi:pyridoxamine 5'-phosphate oxidase family protein [uncultured Algibacter sp.]|jgi:nitroimidazol reductase NimA-like FMN-containing flavoprotein (pyridoxamine 5'-phosphate oxidase superfamily)|uniref:pyridoxamine 5'-phosphate oxidase family protein n=1 Tax=uncultured Algibacter sp. TaxID=298659 RepID=UPI00260B41BE|nr:pyridoxamine 5'-phosphate oxidase family protein [uncultured Algibacter sp.]
MKTYEKTKLNRVKRGQKRATYDVEKINTILDSGFIGYVSYVYKNRAITLPMAYGRKDNKIYLHGSQANRMLLALLEAKEMSMTVMHLDALVLARSGLHHSVNYRSVTLFGSVKKIEAPKEKDKALFYFMEHMMKGRWDGIRPMHKKELDRTLVVEMTINTASAKIRDVGVGDEPEDYDLNVWAGLVPLKLVAEYPIADEGIPTKMDIPKHVLEYYEQNKG